ncbi:MAG: undecaprenyl-diphosphate phosphatase [Caulobacterales bacterium]
MHEIILAIILGILEGLTEFLPVSSTGHLLVAGKLLGFSDPGGAFVVMIQLGAILAVVALYFQKLWSVLLRLPTDPEARRFVMSVAAAFLPAAVVGLLLHDIIKTVFFETPFIIACSFIIGGVLILLAEKFRPEPVNDDAERLPLWKSFVIGCFQCLAIVPGMSRSGSTIIGALLFKVERRAAAEFSFFLAMPTMLGAFVIDFISYKDTMKSDQALMIAIGFVTAFFAALVVVKPFLNFVGKSGFAPFAWYRIAFGVGMLALFGTPH